MHQKREFILSTSSFKQMEKLGHGKPMKEMESDPAHSEKGEVKNLTFIQPKVAPVYWSKEEPQENTRSWEQPGFLFRSLQFFLG